MKFCLNTYLYTCSIYRLWKNSLVLLSNLAVMQKRIFMVLVLLPMFLCLHGQPANIDYGIRLQGSYNGPGQVPFWFRSMQSGSVAPEGLSLGLTGFALKDYDPDRERKVDWGFGAETRLNLGKPSDILLIEGFGKLKYSIFEIRAGRDKSMTGLCDSTLSSGSWSVSGNTLGIPKVEVAVPEFFVLPVFGKLFAFKGNVMHGWLGRTYDPYENPLEEKAYLHQLSFYGRFGKPDWRIKLFGGFNHQVVWGSEDSIMGEDFELSPLHTYLYVATGKVYNNGSIRETRIGNHLGSIDVGLSFDWNDLRLFVYRQFIYDAGALYYLANLRDGLNGLGFANLKGSERTVTWKKVIVEFLYTKNQAGETWSPFTTSPYENYYNNSYYRQGWSYRRAPIGNPFITPASAVKEGFPSSGSYFINNRVMALYLGLEGSIRQWDLITRLSYSKNYGTYLTSATSKIWDDGVNPDPSRIFPVTGQFSALLKTSTLLKNGLQLGFDAACDIGGLYEDTFGIQISLSRTF